uniref:C2H2-type domain-containing protein n=1 Tax=Bracon brevicornis TaxID=1563983 RepID=A0A6V7LZA7_9HYME
MSEITSIEPYHGQLQHLQNQQQHQQQQQQQQLLQLQQSQQYVGGNSNSDFQCKDCGISFDSLASCEVHSRYHRDNLLTQWANQALQEESNNNNSKGGNHNSHIRRDSATTAATGDSSALTPPPSSNCAQNSVQNNNAQVPTSTPQDYNQFPTPIFNETPYFMQNEQPYLLPQLTQHHYSPSTEDHTSSNYAPRYHPYQQNQHYSQDRTNSVNSTSPTSPPQCDKCGVVFESANQLAEHIRLSHTSPADYPNQYQQLGSSPQNNHVNQQQPNLVPQLHPSPPVNNQQQPCQQEQPSANYDYNGGCNQLEMKTEQDEPTQILDLDSHKVQSDRHRYKGEVKKEPKEGEEAKEGEDGKAEQEVVAVEEQRRNTHSVSSMLSWNQNQPQEYHQNIPAMVSMNNVPSNVPSMPDQRQSYMLGQHMPIEAQRHNAVSPIISSTQPMPGHQIPSALLQQPPKPTIANQSWKSNEARRPKTYNCTACNKWFTSSGHLKRHYNTTLHKNAVKQSNQPDPANLPISTHHHPGRDNASSRGGIAPSRSPTDHSTSSSPPNLMAGSSVEATRGLLHQPLNNTDLYNTNNTIASTSNGNSNSSNDSTNSLHQVLQPQPVHPLHQLQLCQQLAQQPQHQSNQHLTPQPQVQSPQHQQGQGMVCQSTSMGSHRSPLQTQMDTPSPQGSIQHHLTSPMHQAQFMNSPIPSPMQPVQVVPDHLTSPSAMANNRAQLRTLNTPPPINMQQGISPTLSPTMGGTSMPQQPYPNALPPHVTTTTSIQQEFIISPLITTGEAQTAYSTAPLGELPGFCGTFINNQGPLPSFNQFNTFTGLLNGPIENLSAMNVGGLSLEELPQDNTSFAGCVSYEIIENKSHESGSPHDGHDNKSYTLGSPRDPQDSKSPHDPYSPPTYHVLGDMDMANEQQRQQLQQQQQQQHSQQDSMIINSYNNMHYIHQHHQGQLYLPLQPLQHQQHQHEVQQLQSIDYVVFEANNNSILPEGLGKEEIDPNRVPAKVRTKKPTKSKKKTAKEFHKTGCHSNANFISENGVHKCLECNKTFNKACYLTQHNKSFHSGDKPFKCNQCGKRFPAEKQYQDHLDKHAGDKPHKCAECPKQFNHKTDLRRHQCLHSGDKPFTCEVCSKGFIRKDHMMKHLETHARNAEKKAKRESSMLRMRT